MMGTHSGPKSIMPGSRADQSLNDILRYHLNIYSNCDFHFSNVWSLQQGKGEILNEKYHCHSIFYYLNYFIGCFKGISALNKHNCIRKKERLLYAFLCFKFMMYVLCYM